MEQNFNLAQLLIDKVFEKFPLRDMLLYAIPYLFAICVVILIFSIIYHIITTNNEED